jgi:hypothetical protein
VSHPFDYPALVKPVAEVIDTFRTKPVFVHQGAKLLFVCGGPIDSAKPSIRQQFVEWASLNLPTCRVFLAEKAAQDFLAHDDPLLFRLAEFEEFLASVADCVIVFPESVGSFAETGYFSAKPEVRHNCLVVNSDQSNSFLNRGPIDLIEQHSKYKKIVLDLAAHPPNFSLIKERLEPHPIKRRTRMSMESFTALKGIQQLAFLLYLFRLFPSVDLQGIKRIIEPLFGKGNYEMERVRHLLSVLYSANYLHRLSAAYKYYYSVPSSAPSEAPLLEIDGADSDKLRLVHLDIYSRFFDYLVPKLVT